MNPLTNVKNVKKLSEQELNTKNKTSWHDQYKDSAWIFVGGLPYDLSEGDIICVFSQYGEIVNINLVRDKETGKQKGYCFLCYEDQRSTILAVDNLNGIRILKRTIRVDHVQNYKVPKDSSKIDDITRTLQNEGCGPGSSVLMAPESDGDRKRPYIKQEKMDVDDIKLPERLPIYLDVKKETGDAKTKSKVLKKKSEKKKSSKSKKKAKKKRKSSSVESDGRDSTSNESKERKERKKIKKISNATDSDGSNSKEKSKSKKRKRKSSTTETGNGISSSDDGKIEIKKWKKKKRKATSTESDSDTIPSKDTIKKKKDRTDHSGNAAKNKSKHRKRQNSVSSDDEDDQKNRIQESKKASYGASNQTERVRYENQFDRKKYGDSEKHDQNRDRKDYSGKYENQNRSATYPNEYDKRRIY